ncbi:hypothetical protein Tcan_08068 [Toxocara canis]|uniref:Uncharacterized protein n=1 Tax=Toxocara canis TaxID=6265 RepID=A0A0B2UQ67_TOXCA|nr:hypothetical protein Tcan_08068 [Toxocara canis]
MLFLKHLRIGPAQNNILQRPPLHVRICPEAEHNRLLFISPQVFGEVKIATSHIIGREGGRGTHIDGKIHSRNAENNANKREKSERPPRQMHNTRTAATKSIRKPVTVSSAIPTPYTNQANGQASLRTVSHW